MSDHHPTLAPSSIPGILACAQYRPSPDATPDSLRGIEHHAEFAALLRSDRRLAEALPIEDRAGVEWAAALVKSEHDPSSLHIEEKVKALDLDFDPLTWGTPDAWAGNTGDFAVKVWDYKAGQQYRDHKGQLAAYALAIMQKTGAEACDTVVLWGARQFAERRRFTFREALDLVIHARERRQSATPPEPNSYCGWCSAWATCSALAERVEAIRKGRPDWALEQYETSKINDPAEMAKALELARQVKQWAAHVEHFAKEMARVKGLKIPGFELEERKGHRTVENMAAAYERAGLPIIDFLACCDVSLPALEIAYATKTQSDNFAASKRALAEKLGGAVTRKKPSFNLKSQKTHAED